MNFYGVSQGMVLWYIYHIISIVIYIVPLLPNLWGDHRPIRPTIGTPTKDVVDLQCMPHDTAIAAVIGWLCGFFNLQQVCLSYQQGHTFSHGFRTTLTYKPVANRHQRRPAHLYKFSPYIMRLKCKIWVTHKQWRKCSGISALF